MHDINTRINAAIPYFFLGPFFLLAKAGTPLAHPFVQLHARVATKIIGGGILSWVIYFFLRDLLSVGFLGISLQSIVIGTLMSILMVRLILGAYQAFQGIPPKTTFQNIRNLFVETEFSYKDYSEEVKIRITLSFLPFIGIILAEKFPLPEILIARKVGNFFTSLLIMSSILFGNGNSLFFIIILIFLSIIITTGVQLIKFGRFLVLPWYTYIPTYHEIEAHGKTSLLYIGQWLRAAFGKKISFSYKEKYKHILAQISRKIAPTQPYWTHPAIIAVPIINIFTLPSFFQKQYTQYRIIVIEGAFLTLCVLMIWFIPHLHPYFFYFLLFPITTLGISAKRNLYVRAPITSIAVEGALFIDTLKTELEAQSTKTIEEHYTYIHSTIPPHPVTPHTSSKQQNTPH